MAGAPRPDDLAGALRDAGFEEIVINEKEASRELIKSWLPGSGCERYVVSAEVSAFKPGGNAAASVDAGADAMPARMRQAARRQKTEAAEQAQQKHQAAKGGNC